MEEWAPLQPKKRKHHVWLWIVGAVVFFLVVGSLLSSRDKPSTSTPASPPSSSSSSSASSSDAYSPGQRFVHDEFAISVPFGHEVEFRTSLGSGYSVKEVQDPGTYFCLVPVRIYNRSTSTESFLPLSWYLHADEYRFETSTGADYYLDEGDQLDAMDIPPGIARQGKIVFLVTSQAKQASRILLELNDWGTKALFDLSDL